MKAISLLVAYTLTTLFSGSAGLKHDGPQKTATLSSAASATRRLDHDANIETKYDGFNHETVVTLKKMSVTCGSAKGLQSTLKNTCVSLQASLHCPGLQLDYVRYAKLELVFEAKDWDARHPFDERELVVVADGGQLKLGTMSLAKQAMDTDKLVDVMKEVLEVSVPYQTFNRIARAQIVSMKVGKTTFELKETNLAALRDLNNRVRP